MVKLMLNLKYNSLIFLISKDRKRKKITKKIYQIRCCFGMAHALQITWVFFHKALKLLHTKRQLLGICLEKEYILRMWSANLLTTADQKMEPMVWCCFVRWLWDKWMINIQLIFTLINCLRIRIQLEGWESMLQ